MSITLPPAGQQVMFLEDFFGEVKAVPATMGRVNINCKYPVSAPP